jgi:hypothetical protein
MDRAPECHSGECADLTFNPLYMIFDDHNFLFKVLWAGLPGTETGNGLADVLFGK